MHKSIEFFFRIHQLLKKTAVVACFCKITEEVGSFGSNRLV